MASQPSNNGNSSSGCGKFLGIVFVVLILVGAWNSFNGHQKPSQPAPTTNPTICCQITTPPNSTPTVTTSQVINPSEICNAYYSILDPNYEIRCNDAISYVDNYIFPQGQYHETQAEIQAFNAYYTYQADEEYQHMHEANHACDSLDWSLPDYSQQCNDARNADWEPPNAWPYASTN